MGIVVTDDEYSPSIVVKTYDDKPDDNTDDDICSVSRETVCQLMLMERTEPFYQNTTKNYNNRAHLQITGISKFVD